MNDLIKYNMSELDALCIKYQVQALDVFGSITHSDFNVESSDIDFMVEFTSDGILNYADNYFGLLDDLESLFNRSVDLVVRSSVTNPYFLDSVEKDSLALYAA